MALDGFWSDKSIEPKRKYRWVLTFNGVPQWILKKVAKPQITITEAEHTFINYKFYYPGRVEWNEISLTLVDPVAPDASKTMASLIRSAGYVPPHNFLNANNDNGPFKLNGRNQASKIYTMSKQRAVDAVGGRMYIQQLDADGELLEEWALYNPWIKSVNFDELDYESDDLLNLEVSIRYDWADINPGIRDPNNFNPQSRGTIAGMQQESLLTDLANFTGGGVLN